MFCLRWYVNELINGNVIGSDERSLSTIYFLLTKEYPNVVFQFEDIRTGFPASFPFFEEKRRRNNFYKNENKWVE